jgi:Protein of unknown function, DUF273
MKIAVCTLAINEWYFEIVKYGVKTIENYAKRHNYDFYMPNDVYDGKRSCAWYKIKAIQKIISHYDYVVWIDADGFIMKPEIPISFFIDSFLKDRDLLCSKDNNNTLNTGIMVIRNTPFIHSLLQETWNNKNNFDPDYWEQASMGEIYDNNRLQCQNKLVILPLEMKRFLYSYWSEYFPGKTFFLHIARCSKNPSGFILTLDKFCPIKMDEDKNQEYEDRISWLQTESKCRKDIDSWINQTGIPRFSTRSLEYMKRYQNK